MECLCDDDLSLSNKSYLFLQLVFVHCLQLQREVSLIILGIPLANPSNSKMVYRVRIQKPSIMILFLSSIISVDMICLDVYFFIMIFSIIRGIFKFILITLFRSACLNQHTLCFTIPTCHFLPLVKYHVSNLFVHHSFSLICLTLGLCFSKIYVIDLLVDIVEICWLKQPWSLAVVVESLN